MCTGRSLSAQRLKLLVDWGSESERSDSDSQVVTLQHRPSWVSAASGLGWGALPSLSVVRDANCRWGGVEAARVGLTRVALVDVRLVDNVLYHLLDFPLLNVAVHLPICISVPGSRQGFPPGT